MKRLRRQLDSAQPPSLVVAGITAREWYLLAFMLTAGVLLRIIALSRAAVEHFDEGVYASNIFFGPPEYAYPLQRFYAPPLLPGLIEVGAMAGLPPNLAALLPSLVAGCVTIAAVWWVGRYWFGPSVGLAAATLAALADFHIAYSAAALTDVLLGLWLLLAVDAIGRSLAATDLRWAIGAGIYTGLAWWTKYNGWLPLAIEALTLPLLWLLLRPPPRQLVSWLGCLAVTALVAGAVWAPYYFSLQAEGGYAPIAANHAKYVVGLAGWLHSASQQIAAQYVMEGPATWIGTGLAWTGALALKMPRIGGQWRVIVLALVALLLLMGGIVAAGSIIFGAVAGAIGLLLGLRAGREGSPTDSQAARRRIGVSLVAVWWFGLLLATPCYWPYPRLILPWLIASWLAAAIALEALACDIVLPMNSGKGPSAFRSLLIFIGIGTAIAAGAAAPPQRHPPGIGNDRRDLPAIANAVRESARAPGPGAANSPRAIYVWGEPALFFQLRAAGEAFVGPVAEVPTQQATLEGQGVETFLLIGPHALRDPQFNRQWADTAQRWELSQAFDYLPSPLVWLDLNNPRDATPEDHREQNQFRLYRLRSRGP